jgi:hypothetical protein
MLHSIAVSERPNVDHDEIKRIVKEELEKVAR